MLPIRFLSAKQQQHRANWERWYSDNVHTLPRTGWLFHGESIG